MGIETVWCTSDAPQEGLVNTIPYFVEGVAQGDRIRFDDNLEQAAFAGFLKGGGHSGFRIIVMGHANKEQVLRSLSEVGVDYDQSPWPALLGLDVAPEVELKPIADLLDSLSQEGAIGCEVAVIQHV